MCFLFGRSPPMHTPSPETPIDSMTWLEGFCDLGHRVLKALQ
ncbi:hypothetical protein SynA1825c_01806 [Synechococcus sp. A18-25c]|nr:hypothetical protein SynA1825c_01806 [Synechococcus sp. A18-25c]